MNSKLNQYSIIAGLDIGSDSIKLAIGTYNYTENTFEIIGAFNHVTSGVFSGLISNVEKTVENIDELIKKAEELTDISINSFIIGLIDLSLSKSKTNKILKSENSEVEISLNDISQFKKILSTELYKKNQEILYLTPTKYILDNNFELSDALGQRCKKLEGHYIAYYLSSTSVKNAQRTIETLNKHLEKTSISSLAASLAILTKEEKNAGVCLLDIGKSTTKMTVYFDGILQNATIFPIGSEHLTLDIKEAFELPLSKSEKIKQKFSNVICQNVDPNVAVEVDDKFTKSHKTIPLTAIAAVLEARVTELITYVNKSLLDTGIKEKLQSGIVLTGAGAKLTKLCELVETITNMECRLATFNNNIKLKASFNDPLLYSTAVGLVMNSCIDIDYREELYSKYKIESKNILSKKEKEYNQKGLLSKVWVKTKSLLIDDFIDQ